MSETTTTPARPIWNDEMNKELAKIVGAEVNKWCNNKLDLEECIEAAEKVLRHNRHDDGYELAKEFENEGFSSDSELVDILDGVYYDVRKIEENAVKKWVTDNGLTLLYKVGDRVKAKLVRKGEIECEIMKLYPETMQYGLWYEGMQGKKGECYTIVNYEHTMGVLPF